MTTTQGVHQFGMQQKIENYIQGKLSQSEIDKLWIEFLKAPKWYKYFEIELHLKYLIRNSNL